MATVGMTSLSWPALLFRDPSCCCRRREVASAVSDSAAPWTAARQAPPSMGFSSKNTSGLPFPSPPKLLGDMRNMKLSNQAGWPFWTEHKKSSWLQQILEKPESSWPPIRACPDSRQVFQRFMLMIFSLTFSLIWGNFASCSSWESILSNYEIYWICFLKPYGIECRKINVLLFQRQIPSKMYFLQHKHRQKTMAWYLINKLLIFSSTQVLLNMCNWAHLAV